MHKCYYKNFLIKGHFKVYLFIYFAEETTIDEKCREKEEEECHSKNGYFIATVVLGIFLGIFMVMTFVLAGCLCKNTNWIIMQMVY